MTPLRPVETDRVRGVPSVRYPLNTVCSFPGCKRTDVTAHHIFGTLDGTYKRSWWVEVDRFSPYPMDDYGSKIAIPAVTGACGHGTEGHHGDYEAHKYWIRYEDGIYNVYERNLENYMAHRDPTAVEWKLVGPLDPQPPNTEKRRTRAGRKQGKEKRDRRTISFHVPKDAEGHELAGVIDDNIETAEKIMFPDDPRSPAWTLADLTNFGVLWLRDEQRSKLGG